MRGEIPPFGTRGPDYNGRRPYEGNRSITIGPAEWNRIRNSVVSPAQQLKRPAAEDAVDALNNHGVTEVSQTVKEATPPWQTSAGEATIGAALQEAGVELPPEA